MYIVNITELYADGKVFLPDFAHWFAFVSSVIITIVGTTLNLFVLICLTKYAPRIRNETSTKFVLNLAIADLLFCTIAIPSGWVS